MKGAVFENPFRYGGIVLGSYFADSFMPYWIDSMN
jgi:hypothetical protein